MKKKFAIASLLVLVVLILTACGGPEDTYKQAQELLSMGKYSEAAEKFESLGSYEDASTLTIYCKACALCESGNHKTGITALENLGDYKDSQMRITYYTARSLDDSNVNTNEFELMEQAKSIYSKNPLYLDSAERITALDTRIEKAKTALYNAAVETGESGSYGTAQNEFKRLGNYKDSENRYIYYGIRADEDAVVTSADQDAVLTVAAWYSDMGNYLDCIDRDTALKTKADGIAADKYAKVAALVTEGKYAEAEAALAAFGEYGNEQVTANYYAIAENYLAANQWGEASAAFKNAADYSDAKDRIKEPYYKQGDALIAESKWNEAIAAFENAGTYSDAKTRIVYCNLRIEENALAETSDWNALSTLAANYSGLGEYLDCVDHAVSLNERATAILDNKYEAAAALMKAKKYEDAITAFNEIIGYKDSAAQIKTCKTAILDGKYEAAAVLMSVEKYEEAIAAFTEIKTHKDSAAQIKACQTAILDGKYDAAIVLMNDGKYTLAYDAFIALNDHKDSKEKAEQLLKEHRNKIFLVGNVVTFGSYEQDNNLTNGKEKIEWVVLAKEDDRMLVITRYLFDHLPYHEQRENVTWENCTLRKWLNSTFLNQAFNSEEQAAIPTVTVSGDKNSNATQDKVFLLSIEEVNKYFSSDNARRGIQVHKKDYSWYWWLRSPGRYEQQRAAYILTSGGIDTTGTHVNSDYIFVRPALWIDLNH